MLIKPGVSHLLRYKAPALVVPSFAAFDPATAGTGAVFSNSNRAVTFTQGFNTANQGVKSNRGHSSGIYYCEVTLDAGATYIGQIGICDAAEDLTTHQVGSDTSGPQNAALFTFYSSSTYIDGYAVNSGAATAAGSIIGVLVDITNGYMWFTVDGTNYNPLLTSGGSAGGAPTSSNALKFRSSDATNGGHFFAGSGPYFLAVSDYGGGTDIFHANFGQATYAYSVPLGASNW
jgi:hypothetical protein